MQFRSHNLVVKDNKKSLLNPSKKSLSDAAVNILVNGMP